MSLEPVSSQSNKTQRMLSCIQPTGEMHLGNYLGALHTLVQSQYDGDAFYGIADLHALTDSGHGNISQRTLECASMLFAAGIDPKVACVFVQSHVPQHSQLAWITQCTVSFGELHRAPQFKVKSAKQTSEFVSAGLFTYPALQAADILLYDAELVPVGADQRQHIEITRDIAIRFNQRYGDTFVVPKAITPMLGSRVMNLQDPSVKMSKSAGADAGVIYLTDTSEVIAKKFKRAVTDSSGIVRYDGDVAPGVTNLLEILGAVTNGDPVKLAASYTQYGKLKTDCSDAVIAAIAPITKTYHELLSNPAELQEILRLGALQAREVASVTLVRAYSAVGLLPSL
jgi:tryptophanyl-tRNA synthetase